ncbi:hypothetical protein MBT84_05910 [Streptomyces sp. MBT84]|nr:hypothetical protein [Streptomyces sp. MBT84]
MTSPDMNHPLYLQPQQRQVASAVAWTIGTGHLAFLLSGQWLRVAVASNRVEGSPTRCIWGVQFLRELPCPVLLSLRSSRSSRTTARFPGCAAGRTGTSALASGIVTTVTLLPSRRRARAARPASRAGTPVADEPRVHWETASHSRSAARTSGSRSRFGQSCAGRSMTPQADYHGRMPKGPSSPKSIRSDSIMAIALSTVKTSAAASTPVYLAATGAAAVVATASR